MNCDYTIDGLRQQPFTIKVRRVDLYPVIMSGLARVGSELCGTVR